MAKPRKVWRVLAWVGGALALAVVIAWANRKFAKYRTPA